MEAVHQDLWILPVIVLNSLHFISNILRWKITSHSSTSNQVRPNFPSDSQTTKVFFSTFTMDSSQLDSSIDLPIIGGVGALHGLPRPEKKTIAINIGVHIIIRSVSEYFKLFSKWLAKIFWMKGDISVNYFQIQQPVTWSHSSKRSTPSELTSYPLKSSCDGSGTPRSLNSSCNSVE